MGSVKVQLSVVDDIQKLINSAEQDLNKAKDTLLGASKASLSIQIIGDNKLNDAGNLLDKAEEMAKSLGAEMPKLKSYDAKISELFKKSDSIRNMANYIVKV